MKRVLRKTAVMSMRELAELKIYYKKQRESKGKIVKVLRIQEASARTFSRI